MVNTDRYMDAAGSMDTTQEFADLCPDCMKRHLMQFLKKLSYVEGKEWIRKLKHRQ